MTSFGVQCVGTPMLSPYYSDEKGDIANRIQCATEQTKNAAVTAAKAGTIVAGTVLVGYVMKKCPKITETIGKMVGKGIGKILKTTTATSNPKLAAIAAVLTPAVAVLGYVIGKGIYQSGQIDQKYTDAAKVEAREKGYLL